MIFLALTTELFSTKGGHLGDIKLDSSKIWVDLKRQKIPKVQKIMLTGKQSRSDAPNSTEELHLVLTINNLT